VWSHASKISAAMLYICEKCHVLYRAGSSEQKNMSNALFDTVYSFHTLHSESVDVN
jgi:hypothetical protein